MALYKNSDTVKLKGMYACMNLFPAVWPLRNYFRFLIPVSKTGSLLSEAKLTSKSLRKGSTERTKHVWPPIEQMTSRIGARAQTGSRNNIMAILWRPWLKSNRRPYFLLVPYCMYGPIFSRLAANKLLSVFTSGFQNRKYISEAKLTSKSHRNESTEPKPEVEIWRPWLKSNRRPHFLFVPPLHVWTYFQPFDRKQTTSGFFDTGSRISEAKLTSKSHRNEFTERTKLVRPPVELNYISDGR